MFERYTERARRAIFFARYEASTLHSGYIEPEHLLLGVLREDRLLASTLSSETIRKQIAEVFPHGEPVSTAVDMPLNRPAKRVLHFAMKEAKALKQQRIDTGHLVLGLLCEKDSVAAKLLKQNGINATMMRRLVTAPAREVVDEPPPMYEMDAKPAAEIAPVIVRLHNLINAADTHLSEFSYADADTHLAQKSWTRKQALGHLIDWATTYQHWFARALTEPTLVAPAYPQEEWVAVQDYASFPWHALVRLWVGLNLLIVHVLARIPEDRVKTPCRIGIEQPMPLSQLIAGYVEHCEDELARILTHG